MMVSTMISSSLKKKCGPTCNIVLQGLRPGEKIKVAFNEYNQLVKQKKMLTKLHRDPCT